jgi:sporulation protein YlmC with PRC-barrel domain
METKTKTIALEPLSQSGVTVRDPNEDIRGRKVLDRDGEELGTVKDLFIDRAEMRIRFMELGAGGILGIGEETFLIPIDAITDIDEDAVRIDQTVSHVAGGPRYQPDMEEDRDYYGDVYAHYDVPPYWGTGYAYPKYPYYRKG